MKYYKQLEAKDLATAESKKNNREIYDYKLVYKESIMPGDTIIWENNTATVSRKDLKKNSFTGLTIFGDSCMLGLRKIVKIIYKNWSKINKQ